MGAFTAEPGGEILDGGVEAGVGVAFGEMRDELPAESFGFFWWFWWHGGVVSSWWSRLPKVG